MAVQLYQAGLDCAKQLVREGKYLEDERGEWDDHRPSVADENDFIEKHGIQEYAKWHLGVDDAHPENEKKRYKFPHGDFRVVHKCAVLDAEKRAAQPDIEMAIGDLLGLIALP